MAIESREPISFTNGDGRLFVGNSLDGERKELLSSLGWDWDENRSMWYFLVETEKLDDYVYGFYIGL